LAGYLWAEGNADGSTGFVVLGYAFVVFPVLGSVGVAWAISSATARWESRRLAFPFLAISAAMLTVIPPLTAAEWIGSLMLPRAEATAHLAAKRGRESYDSIRSAHYDALLAHFRVPQRVVEARGGSLCLADGHVIDLLEFDGSNNGVQKFESWAMENLVGREVRVVIPDRVSFLPHYIPGSESHFGRPRPKDGSGYDYGDVPAVVLLGEEVVNARFCRNSRSFGRLFREHVALNL